jgi:quinol monooxygenase YgiN
MTHSSIPQAPPCHVVELRQYTLHPGQRDALIDLFAREFVETQEAQGMSVMGQFRDLDDPDRFVWLRGFASMATRQAGLEAFYGGPVWQAHRDAANATMVDSDNVLLLRPAWPGAGIAHQPSSRALPGVGSPPQGLVDLNVFYLHEPATEALIELCRNTMVPVLDQAGAKMQGWYVSETAPNDFTRLPVREGEHVLVGLAVFDGAADFDAFASSGTWARDVMPQLAPFLACAVETHRLSPTTRSAIHA